MAVRFYDEALAKKIQGWVKDPSLKVLKPDEVTRLFRIKADEADDTAIKLPMIALSREPEIEVLVTGKRALSYDGVKLRMYNSSGAEINPGRAFKLNAIPISLKYQLDIYTSRINEADEYMRNFVFNFVNYPNLTIEIPYNDCKITHESTIYLGNTVHDNSDIQQRLFPDQFTRYTLELTVDNAYLFSVPVKDNVSISSVTLNVLDDGDVVDSSEYKF